MDTPSFRNESAAREKQDGARHTLPLEVQLWIEVSLLVLFGLVMIYSSSSILALKKFGDTGHYLKKQLFCIGLGFACVVFARTIPYKWYKEHVRWMLLVTLTALLLVLIPGVGAEINNARRWFQLKILLLQPAEYAKVVWIIFLSVSLVKKQERITQAGIGFWPHVVLCGVMGALLMKEPDFGTTFIIGCLAFMMMAVGGVPFRHLFMLVPFAALGFYKLVYLSPYRWERVTAFLNPWTNPRDSGYQLIQAWIAVGTGGWWGKGLGAGQQKLFYLPESYTDFILAVIGEELGFFGILAISVLFFALFRTGLKISRYAPDFLGTLMALGLTLMLSLQALLNMSVVLGLVPTKGLPLPFISYGGSAFTANCLAVGILMNIARSSEKRVS